MISLSELRKELNLPPGKDDDLEGVRDEVIDMWEQQTGMLWNQRTAHVETRRLTGDPRPYTLMLELQPVSAITKVEERDLNGSWTTLDADDYELIGRRRLERVNARWNEMVRVTYDGGVSSASADVRRALILQALFLRTRMGPEKIAITSQTFEKGTTRYETAFLHPFFRRLSEQKRRRA